MIDHPRTRDPVAKLAALHSSAFELLSTQRYEDVPVSMIAAHAGVAVGTFYRFYPTKMALLEAMSDALEDRFVSAMRAAWDQGRTYEDKIARLASILFDVIDAHKTEIGVMQMTAGHRSKDSDLMGDKIRREIAILYADGVANGGFDPHDPMSFAAAGHGVVEGLMRQYLMLPTVANKARCTGLLTVLMMKLVSP
jgi:AcrR family transcriptional regulator